MNNLNFLFTATFIIYIVGILAVLLLPKKITTKALSIFGSIGSLTLFIFAINILFGANSYNVQLWSILNIGKFTITVDHLSAFFLIVTAIVALPASIFAGARLDNNPKDHNGFLAALFLSLLIAIVLVLSASHVFFFLLSWEVMSILIYFLVNSGKEEHYGYVMLAIGESGTLAILISLLLLSTNADTLSFAGLSANASNLSAGLQWAIFILSFFGFGIKAGLIPLNFWIPRAYTATPSAFIPIIAGATLNLGLYGIIRINIDFLSISEVGIGVVILIVGAMTAIVGILYATIEDDFKTVLAHSSIENAGIITTALGAGVIFLTTGHRVVASMALVAALYHLLNHSVFKTLLFMGAGTLEEASGSRSLNQLGGLLKKMPWTGFFVLIGVLSISAMPPFNGFASEWLILESLLRSVELSSFGIKIAFIIAGATLALTAGLAVTCFVRLFAMSFLGMPRTKSIKKAKEATKSTLASMAFLAFMSLSLGVLPTFVIPAINKSVKPLIGVGSTEALVPSFFTNHNSRDKLPKKFLTDFQNIGARIAQEAIPLRGLVVMHRGGDKNPVVFAMSTSYMFVMMIFLLGLSTITVWFFVKRKRKVLYRPRWDGGVRHFLSEMTYTATGFAQPVRVIFDMILHPNVTNEHKNVAEHFRVKIQRRKEEIHLVDRLILYPAIKLTQKLAITLAKMHNGRINTYASYGLLSLIILLGISFIL